MIRELIRRNGLRTALAGQKDEQVATSVTGVIAFAADVAFAVGDRLLITCASPADATLADTTILIVGSL